MTTDRILVGEQIKMQLCTLDYVTEKYVSWMNFTEVNQYVESRFVNQNLDTVKEYVQSNLESENMLLMAITVQDGRHIRNFHFTFNWTHKRCFIAYIIGEQSYWGRGIATETIKLGTKFAFENYDIARLDGALYAKNVGSGKAVMRAGFKQEGIRKSYILLDNGERDDMIEVGLTREDYEKNMSQLGEE
jgi:RimJ/RimL family protein N-acetyltransferase